MELAGIDGCPHGWIMVKSMAENYTYHIYEHFSEIIRDHPNLHRILVDMPIGLSTRDHRRNIDQQLRKNLDGRKSTVFNAPCRAAVYAKNPEQAKKENQIVEGKSLSIQSLSLCQKIREIDRYLSSGKADVDVFESHPEFCFKHLNTDCKVIDQSKHTLVGRHMRLEILRQYDQKLPETFLAILNSTKRKYVKPDDIIDALCLCLVNKLGFDHSLSFLKTYPARDNMRIEMKIAYYQS